MMKNKEKGLELYYSGDKDWDEMVQMAKEDFWIDSDYQGKLLNTLKNHLDIAMVIYARLGNGSLNWVNQKIPALDNLTPLECLESSDLIKRLKEGLMRFPC